MASFFFCINYTKITSLPTACLMFELNPKSNTRVSHIPFYSVSFPPVSRRMEATNSTQIIQNMHFCTFELYFIFAEAEWTAYWSQKSNVKPKFNIFVIGIFAFSFVKGANVLLMIYSDYGVPDDLNNQLTDVTPHSFDHGAITITNRERNQYTEDWQSACIWP